MIDPAPAEHRRRTSVYTIEFEGTPDDLERAAANAQEVTSLAGSGFYGSNSLYLRVRVADDAIATYSAFRALSPLGITPTVIHTGVGPSRRTVQI